MPEPPVPSDEPDALTSVEAMFCHPAVAPVTVGFVGSVRSRRTVLPSSGAAGAHAEALPAPSPPWNWTIVSPSAETEASDPTVGADQVTPPSVDVLYW